MHDKPKKFIVKQKDFPRSARSNQPLPDTVSMEAFFIPFSEDHSLKFVALLHVHVCSVVHFRRRRNCFCKLLYSIFTGNGIERSSFYVQPWFPSSFSLTRIIACHFKFLVQKKTIGLQAKTTLNLRTRKYEDFTK